MTDFILHGIPGSPYLQAALLGFEEKGVPYRLSPLAFGAYKTPEYLARHPFGRMPLMEHGDFVLYETQAFLRYLDRLFPEPALTPASPEAEARMNQVAGIVDWYLLPQVSGPITFQRVAAPRFGLPVDEARLAAALPNAQVCIAELSRLLGDQPFMAGDSLSIADLMLAPQLAHFAQTEESWPILGAHPNLARWIERMEARPSMRATAPEQLMQRQAA